MNYFIKRLNLMLLFALFSLTVLRAAEQKLPAIEPRVPDPAKQIRDEKIQNKFAEVEAAYNFAKNYELLPDDVESLLKEIKNETEKFLNAMDTLAIRQFTQKEFKTSKPLISFPRMGLDPLMAKVTEKSLPIWDASGRYVLMVSYVPQRFINVYEPGKPYTTHAGRIITWASPVPQLREAIRKFTNIVQQRYAQPIRQSGSAKLEVSPAKTRKGAISFGLNKRIQQYLGLQPSLQKYYCVEMWVRPEDLFRVCLNPSVEKDTCEVPSHWNVENYYAGIQKDLLLRHDATFRKFMIDKFRDTYRIDPWPYTALGFTFDWGTDPKTWDKEGYRGADEFGVLPASTVIIRLVKDPEAYATLPRPAQRAEDVFSLIP